uniref:N-acetyltransferase domain-containing protein n=1 Tax=Panagrellus redivivus TaxID=6233 RepID=A0A7E4V6H5_PANRE
MGAMNIEIVSDPDEELAQQCMEFYLAEGWNSTPELMARLKAAYTSENFKQLIAIDKETGKVLGSVLTALVETKAGNPIMLLGSFIVTKLYRGQGIGTHLFRSALNADPRFHGINRGICSVDNMSEKYSNIFGYSNKLEGAILAKIIKLIDIDLSQLDVDPMLKVVPFEKANYNKVLTFDTKCTGLNRRKFLKAWMTPNKPELSGKVALDDHGNVIGFIRLSEGPKRRLVPGPWFAKDKLIATTLLKSALDSIPNLYHKYESLRFITYISNTAAMQTIDDITVSGTPIMKLMFGQFTGDVLNVNYDYVYNLTEISLGIV